MDGDRFVVTKAIRTAAKGREIDVLDALGIDWRRGRPHINCPYPDHSDNNPSWRFDSRTGRAFCTCITDRKSDGIFDIVMKMKADDFEAAKIIVAEMLHRDDLIKTKIGNNSGPRQKFDAESLLNPPADNRNDELVYRYLGACLRIDADEVPRPSTKAVGITSLAYFDPPAKNAKNAKMALVGHWPCAVFETIAADGRTHAVRIYLNENSDGKAELGQDAGGKERDPKKSARRHPQGLSTAGCCAVWGNANSECVILAEGIENAAAIAASVRDEIEKGELAVLSAITAGGVEAFTPWPGTRHITIAADRDEGKRGAGFKRGEKAARNLALCLAQQAKNIGPLIHTLLGLPGEEGTNTDFRDVFRAEGPTGVCALIVGAAPIVPTAEEIAEFKQRTAQQNKIAEITAAFSQLPLIGLRVAYRATETEQIWLCRFKGIREDRETGEHEEIWEAISSPFGNFVLLVTTGERITHGLRVHVQTFTGAVNTIDFMRSELPQLGASGVRSALMGAGVRVANGGEMTIVEILKQVQPNDCIDIARSFGWTREGDIFLGPGGNKIC